MAPDLLMWVYMRNLGLALLFSAMIAAPHAVHAKKHPVHKKHGRVDPKRSKASRAPNIHTVAPSENDELASAVAVHRAEPKPTLTAQASAPPPAEARPANEPLTITNQVLDDEVPGTRKKK